MTIDLMTFLIMAFATYRLSYMIHTERGPADIFGRFRTRIGVKFDTYSAPYATNWVAEGVLCFYCLSVWVGMLITLFVGGGYYLGIENVVLFILMPFALSGAAILLFKRIDK